PRGGNGPRANPRKYPRAQGSGARLGSGIGTTGQYPRQDLIPGNMDDASYHRDDEAVLGVRATRVSGWWIKDGVMSDDHGPTGGDARDRATRAAGVLIP